MSDVYGYTVRKLVKESDQKITFAIWSLVAELCLLSAQKPEEINSHLIMKFLENSPPPRWLLLEMAQYQKKHSSDRHAIIGYVKQVLQK